MYFLSHYAVVSGHCLICESFAGLEQFNSDKSKCQEHFDVYKECKKKEVCMLAIFFHIYMYVNEDASSICALICDKCMINYVMMKLVM